MYGPQMYSTNVKCNKCKVIIINLFSIIFRTNANLKRKKSKSAPHNSDDDGGVLASDGEDNNVSEV